VSSPYPPLACPACRTPLAAEPDELTCEGCRRRFPVVCGIPDLRLRSDRYLSLDADREKARALAQHGNDFETLVRAYWAMTPEVPPALARRYADHMLDGPRRAASHARRIVALTDGRPSPPLYPHPADATAPDPVLDVGCGTGGLLVALARLGRPVVGVDLALRWLVVARAALGAAGVDGLLVAADGGRLPFARGAFGAVSCVETLEHAEDQRGLLHGGRSALGPGGVLYLVTANRFTVAVEPTSGLWGVGLLPRRWAPGYVARRRHTRYQFFRPLSTGELGAMLGPEPDARVSPAVLAPPAIVAPAWRRGAHALYDTVIRWPAPRRLLRPIVPHLEVVVRRRPTSPRDP
jgi:SAM-dependent methyltransferase/uncharacterized protein YbaR (Trm112 family)